MPSASKFEESAYSRLPYVTALTTYLGYAVLIVFGHIRDAFAKLFKAGRFAHRLCPAHDGRAPLLSDFEDFYTRRLYFRIHDCWGRPIRGTAGAWINVLERANERGWSPHSRPHMAGRRVPHDQPSVYQLDTRLTGLSHKCLNLGSYNYLGYAEVPGGVDESVRHVVKKWGVAACDVSASTGRSSLIRQLERTVADFLGKDDCFVVGMGFATNSQIIPALVGHGDLIVSDALNHASIVVGARASGASIRVFAHNCMASLEETLRDAIVTGQSGSAAPWRRILIVIESMYSMEGETCRLRDIIAIKKKYSAYLYLDEAHSIGALGPTGRGVTEHAGVDTRDVDIMMGTFTKSFGAVGGYIAASKDIVNRIRATAPASLYASGMSPPCAQHIIWAFNQLAGRDGTQIGKQKIRALRDNAIYFRQQLMKMGVQTTGDWDSPVVPIMLYNPAKIAAFSRECYSRGLAVVVVGFPATPLLLSRARICLSAAHTRKDLDWALSIIDEVASIIEIKYDRSVLQRLLPRRVSQWLESLSRSCECAHGLDGHEHCTSARCVIREDTL